MEVHSHTHTLRKKWTHYFWEFLMLFLAVFCGFIAENIREHSIEHQREKKYMRSMLDDLQSDSIMLELYQNRMVEQSLGFDTLIKALNQPLSNRQNLSLVYIMYLKYGQYSYLMPFNENTSSQLKTGGLRLIRNDSVQSAIYEYDKLKRNVSDLAAYFVKLITETENLQANSFFDFSSCPSIIYLTTKAWFGVNTDSLIKRSEKDSLKLINSSFERIATFRNMIRSIMSMNVNLHNWTVRAIYNNERLRRIIKKEYHLE